MAGMEGARNLVVPASFGEVPLPSDLPTFIEHLPTVAC
jgi:hypothetical protein